MVSAKVLSICSLILVRVVAAEPDPLEIVQKALDFSRRDDNAYKNYTITQQVFERELDDSGNVTSTTTKTYENFMLYGEPYRRLIQRNGQPLPSGEERKEQQKYESARQSRKKESPEQRKERIAEYEQKVAKRREMLDEVARAFAFRHLGSETIDGMDAWILEAKPRPDYKPSSYRTSFFTSMEGKFWISKQYHRLLKVDAVTTGPVTFGWFLAKLGPGTRIAFEQARLEDGVWVMKRLKFSYQLRIALVKKVHSEMETVMTGFRRRSSVSENPLLCYHSGGIVCNGGD